MTLNDSSHPTYLPEMISFLLFCTAFLSLFATLGHCQSWNCPLVNNIGGINCSSPELCCGAGTINPSCLPECNIEGMHCCRWFLSATQCNRTESCCGSLGPGASSSAFCCPPKTFCCQHSTGVNTCCNMGDTCCGLPGATSWCCPARCSCPAAPAQPGTCDCPPEDTTETTGDAVK